MRLTQTQREIAKQELLELLSDRDFRTSELSGTPKFHGQRTLRVAAVRALLHELRKEGKVQYRQGGQGKFTYFDWSLSTTT
jgi:hypothetical protein